ncbi:MAG: mannose-1-phosphate guanylyltransferase [Calditrichia bacterium]
MSIYATLMAGGVGTRFWPRSRKTSPKQVLNIANENTMIQATHQRLKGLVDDSKILIVTNHEQKPLIHEQLSMLTDSSFVLEPFGRNTAPCIGLAALHVHAADPDGIMVVMPADHLISNVEEFQRVVGLACEFARENGGLITLGITPNEPATGYGYIQSGDVVHSQDGRNVCRVKSFAEKPNLDTAKRFLESGDFFWNSGMFIWRASTILKEIREKLPDIYEPLIALEAYLDSPEYPERLEAMYRQIRGISIDYGVMQEAEEVYVIPTDMGWNDVGSWETVFEISPKDNDGNTGEYRDIISVNSARNYAYSPDKVVSFVGVEDLIVVDTGDALLIGHRDASQDVKEAVEALKKKGLDDLL